MALKLIIGVDPGKTTGVTFFHPDRGLTTVSELPAHQAVTQLWDFLEAHASADLIIAIERYDITRQTAAVTRQYDAIKVTGALEHKARQFDVPFHEYSRTITKKFGSDRKLHQLKLWTPGKVHANDAARVVVTHLAQREPELLRSLSSRH